MEKNYDKNKNYCSMSPDSILGIYINYGCYIHDRHYRNERQSRLSRKRADQLLRNFVYRDLKKSNVQFQVKIPKLNKIIFKSNSLMLIAFRKELAFPLSRLYYYIVRLLGWRYWIKNG